MLPFKVNYGYKLRILLILRQVKKTSTDTKERIKERIELYKNFKSRRLSKKLDYVKLGLFKIVAKILEVMYRLDLPAKMKIYLV